MGFLNALAQIIAGVCICSAGRVYLRAWKQNMRKDSHKPVERQILAASYVSIVGNSLLSVAKIVAGLISGSFAVVGWSATVSIPRRMWLCP